MYKGCITECFFILLLSCLCLSLTRNITVPKDTQFTKNEVHIFLTGVREEENLLDAYKEFSVDSVQNTIESVTSLLFELIKKQSEILRITGEEFEVFVNGTLHSLDAITLQIKHLEKKSAQVAVNTIQDQLSRSKNQLQHIIWNIKERFESTIRRFNESLLNHTESIDLGLELIKKKLRSSNDTKLLQYGCRSIDDFILRSTKRLQACCNIGVKPMQSLCQQFGDVVAEILYNLTDSMDRVQNCLEDKNSYLQYLFPCLNIVLRDVAVLISKAMQIQQKIDLLVPLKIVYSQFCVSFVLVEIQSDHRQVETAFDVD